MRELVRRDIELLKAFKLMDYSLLLAVEHVKKSRGQSSLKSLPPNEGNFGDPSSATFYDGFDANRHKYYSQNGEFIYHVALIDYLQTWNFEKWGESRLKIWILRRNP